jgi:hypothetical protein
MGYALDLTVSLANQADAEWSRGVLSIYTCQSMTEAAEDALLASNSVRLCS